MSDIPAMNILRPEGDIGVEDYANKIYTVANCKAYALIFTGEEGQYIAVAQDVWMHAKSPISVLPW